MNENKIKLLDENNLLASQAEQQTLLYLQQLGYKHISTNVNIEAGRRTLKSDVIVYLDDERLTPYIVVEIKRSLPTNISILDSSVQQAFAIATILGKVKYLLITNGTQFEWFERNIHDQSLKNLTTPPLSNQSYIGAQLSNSTLQPITDSNLYEQLLLSILDVFRSDGMIIGLRNIIELNRILIAKLYDEKGVANGQLIRFTSENAGAEEISERIKILYNNALSEYNENHEILNKWDVSLKSLVQAVRILEKYLLYSVPRSLRDRSFWQLLPRIVSQGEQQFTTPPALAELMIEIARPQSGETIVDPVCGSGLLLLKALEYTEKQINIKQLPIQDFSNDLKRGGNLYGIEISSQIAELAKTNFILNEISPKQIINANSLAIESFNLLKIDQKSVDLIVMNPPIGASNGYERFNYESEYLRLNNKVNSEALFIERAIKLMSQNGRIVVLVSDSFLSSDSQKKIRSRLLEDVVPRVIVSLPRETFIPVGHSGKASLLLLERRKPNSEQEEVFIAQIDSIGYDRFGRPTRENDLPSLIKLINQFLDGKEIESVLKSNDVGTNNITAYKVSTKDLIGEQLNIFNLNPKLHEIIHALKGGRYPTVKLDEIAEIKSGRSFKTYVDSDQAEAILIQAGAVREGKVDISSSPHLSLESYLSARRSQVSEGDVLFTSTGLYLGRTAVFEKLPLPAVVSGSVTILRLNEEIDPYYLSAVLNSDIGREQISQLQAKATAQPYIRRADIGQIIVPLPPLIRQKELAARVSEMLETSQILSDRARILEKLAKETVTSELLINIEND